MLSGVNIDDHVTAGAGDMVTGDELSSSLVVGNPAQVVGQTRAGFYEQIIE